MKFTRFIFPAVLITGVLSYSSCKKSGVKTVTPSATNYKTLSSQVALSLYQAITGKYGGLTVSNGMQAPPGVATQKGPVVDDISQCGFTTTPVSRFTSTSGDTAKTEVIYFKFVSTCSGGTTVNGYTASALDSTVTGNSIFKSVNVVDQSYAVQALDNTYKLVSMNGTLTANTNNTRYSGPYYNPFIQLVNSGNIVSVQKYVLASLVVNAASGNPDVTSGTTTFDDNNTETDSLNPNGRSFGDSGIIVFLGNYMAKVTFAPGTPGSQSFIVNLITGIATPA
jgi:hypothetical protein